jgi:hypothetical protein
MPDRFLESARERFSALLFEREAGLGNSSD